MSKLTIYYIKVIENYIFLDIIINKEIAELKFDNVELNLKVFLYINPLFWPICIPIKFKIKLRYALG